MKHVSCSDHAVLCYGVHLAKYKNVSALNDSKSICSLIAFIAQSI
jgi:hypothetical protein